MNILFFNNWGLGDLVCTFPVIGELNSQKNKLTVVVGSKGNKLLVQNHFSNLEILVFKKKFFFFKNLLFKLLNLDIVIIPCFLNKKIFYFFKLLSIFFRFKVYYKFQKEENRWTSTYDNLYKENIIQNQRNYPFNQGNLNTVKKVLIHVGCDARFKFKKMPIYLIKRIIENLKKNFDITILLGPDERYLLKKIKKYQDKIIISETVKQLRKVLDENDVVISSDTGIGHYASYLKKPTITIFGPTNYKITAPGYFLNYKIMTDNKPSCMPCIFTKKWGRCDKRFYCFRSINLNKLLTILK